MDTRLKLRKALSEGLSSWLTFERHSGREGLFSERYLALPISQILAHHFKGSVEAEHNHPVLASQGRKGRPPQLDFIVREDQKVTLVVESKWAGESGISVADVLWDCVRLELAAYHYGCDGIFIFAGQRDRLEKVLGSKPYNPKTSRGNPSPILNLNGNGRFSVNIQSPVRDFGPSLHEYLNLFPKVSFPRSFVCGSGVQIPKESSSKALVAAVWHIQPEAPVKRFTFTV
ncbi:thermostable hemolysin [Pseudomonas iridis]|uniref:thermostable hemolysin n=1 Tax=Pseudomonas iridis TaxID=2710587 RepID=UPI0021BEDA59|nr:thermostable hemolysin [Pseudomonas iridis]MCT8948487.1 thermostable hemolysin [Pseudomonas iridis]